MNLHAALLGLAALVGTALPAHAADVVAGFEGLPLAPAVSGQVGLIEANNASASYLGIVWDARFSVVGEAYLIDTNPRVPPEPPAPLFGKPHTGQYFVTNAGDGGANDGLRITTSMVLMGAWFGRNEYYGYGAGGGADQVTIHALRGEDVAASVVFDMPELLLDAPEVLQFADTSSFATLAGITGYRINRRELNAPFGGSWVADDFTFAVATPVPEPHAAWMLLGGLALMAGWRRRL